VDGVTEPGGARRFAEFALALRLDDIPVNVIEAAKLHLLDVLGCGLAAVEFRAPGAFKRRPAIYVTHKVSAETRPLSTLS